MGLSALTTALLIIGLDVTVLPIALPTLATAFEASTTELQWITNAYTLPFAALLLPAAALGARGRKRVLVAGLLLFTAGAAGALTADTTGALIGSRAAMGTAAAAVVPLALSVAPGLFPPGGRGRASALAKTGLALGLPLGPLIGGWLLHSYGWQSIFLVNVLLAALALVGVAVCIPESRDPRAKPLDVTGTVLALTGISALAYGVTEAPNRGWTAPLTLLALFTGTSLLCGLVIRLARTHDTFVNPALMCDPRFAWATAALTLMMFILLGLLFVLPQYLQQVQGYDAWATGTRLLPLMAGMGAGTVAGARLVARIDAKWALATGMLLWALGMALVGQLDVASPYGATAAGLITAGAALGLTLSAALDAIFASLPPEIADTGSAVTNTSRQMGAAAGVAALGSVLNTVYRGELQDSAPPELTRAALSSAGENIAAAERAAATLPEPRGASLLTAAQKAFVSGMSISAWVCAAAAALMALAVMALMPGRQAQPTPPRRTR